MQLSSSQGPTVVWIGCVACGKFLTYKISSIHARRLKNANCNRRNSASIGSLESCCRDVHTHDHLALLVFRESAKSDMEFDLANITI